MYSRKSVLSCPSDFNFPFTPYTIQQQLMEELYKVLESKQIGIFESPTGTGKSLTLTCAALKWQEDHENLVRQEINQRLSELQSEVLKLENDSQEASDWITMHSITSQQRLELLQLKELKKLLEQFEEKLHEIKNKEKALNHIRSSCGKFSKLEGELLLRKDSNLNESSEDDKLLEEETYFRAAENCEKYRDVQIFFCSRTHTQLAQVVKEIKRSAYGGRVRCVSLASRQQLCVHPQLRKLNNIALINEKCLDMAKKDNAKAKATSSDAEGRVQKKAKILQNSDFAPTLPCKFKQQSGVRNLSEISLIDVLDIEDLVTEGEKLKVCPYYASRNASELAQMVMLPYQLLLNKNSRQQIGIDLKGSIIIIDEAHNLLDTIAQMHSCELNLHQLKTAHQQIVAYKMKYANRFNSSNLLSINQLLFVIKRLTKVLKNPMAEDSLKKSNSRMLCTYELMSEGDFFNIDLYQLLRFCENSRFAQKIQGFAKRFSDELNPNENQPPVGKVAAIDLLKRLEKNHTEKKEKLQNKQDLNSSSDIQQITEDKHILPAYSPIRPLLSFLEALCEKADDGRILVNIADEKNKDYGTETGFKYILLNPGGRFQDIVQEARAIIVAGGTMQPTAELSEQLFYSCPERVKLKFYDHVVPDDAVLPFVVTKSPSGKNLCFNYAQRSSSDRLTDLCAIIENLCNVVPDGLVCFLPSYEYLDLVYAHLQKVGVLERLASKKRVLKEPRNVVSRELDAGLGKSSLNVEQILNDYAKEIKLKKGGALLLSVVGGKLSEGLNFTDDLGRGVIVVGMPYPNRHSPELRERMSYLDTTLGPGSGSEYYENLCMKAVNQCIGRSVRHVRDYACVYLLDERYARDNIKKKLPKWILRHLKISSAYGQVQGGTAKFFKQKKVG